MAVAKALAYFDTATIMTVVLEYRPQGIMKKQTLQDYESTLYQSVAVTKAVEVCQ